MKEAIGAIAVLLTFISYIPYIKDTLRGSTKPHVYSWFIWGVISLITFGLQVSDGAGPGSLVTLAAAIVCFLIFLLSLKMGSKNITLADTTFLIVSLVATAIWLFAKQPIISVILLSLIDILGFVPTVRKSWNKPYEETLISYLINTIRFGLSLMALEHYSVVSSLYPFTWVFANGLFACFLMIRRHQVR